MKQLSKEQTDLIKKPLPREAVTPHPTKQNLSTIKAIYVTERLNDVFGIGQWTLKTDAVWDDKVSMITEKVRTTQSGRERLEFTAVLKTVLEVPDYGIYYECIASSTNDDAGDACKGATTDAITKICSYIGIGIDVFKGKHDSALQTYESDIVVKAIADINSMDDKDKITEYARSLDDAMKQNPSFRKAVSDKIKSL
jgi:hypothetical protein